MPCSQCRSITFGWLGHASISMLSSVLHNSEVMMALPSPLQTHRLSRKSQHMDYMSCGGFRFPEPVLSRCAFGPLQVGAGGVVRDPAVHKAVIESTISAISGLGFRSSGWIESPIKGSMKGNTEFLAHFRRKPSHDQQ